MPDFTYTAKRNLKSGHSADTEYTITTELFKASDEMPTADKIETVSIGGNVKTVLNRVDTFINIETDWVYRDGTGTPDADDWAEFLYSVAGGEVFTYDDGTARECILANKPTRGENGVLYNYSFRMRVVG